jgi:hypothetical protein
MPLSENLAGKFLAFQPGDVFGPDAQKAFARLQERCGPPRACGRHRVVFESRHVVFKLPRNHEGILDNEREARAFRRRHAKSIAMAPCRLVPWADFPVLAMRKLDLRGSIKDMPSWASWVDCAQLGRDRRGVWLAYDYA